MRARGEPRGNIASVARSLPAVYPYRYFAANGGLASFTIEKLVPMMDEAGVDRVDIVPLSWPGDDYACRRSCGSADQWARASHPLTVSRPAPRIGSSQV